MFHVKKLISSALLHQGFMRYFTNTSWMIGEQILRMVAGLLVGIWVARYLGPSQFGVFSYAVAFASLFSSIAKLGLDSIVVRDLVREPELRDFYMGTAFWLKIIGAVVMLSVIGIAMQFTSSDSKTKLYIFIIASGAIFQSFEVVDFYFQSKVLSKFVSICKLTQLLISSLLKLYLIFIGADLFGFVLVSLIDQVTLALSLYMAYRNQKIGGFFRYFNWSIGKRLLKDGWPQMVSGIAIMAYIRMDQILVQEMLGAKETGIYSAALRLSEVWYFIPVLVSQSLFPSIVSAKKTNDGIYDIRLKRLYSLLVTMSIGVALLMSFFSDWIVVLLYGDGYKEAGRVLMVHIWAGVFVSLGVIGGKWLVTENLQHLMIYRTIGGALLNVTLSIVLIPLLGILGAAIATLISIAASSYLFDFFDKKTRVMFFHKTNALFLVWIFK